MYPATPNKNTTVASCKENRQFKNQENNEQLYSFTQNQIFAYTNEISKIEQKRHNETMNRVMKFMASSRPYDSINVPSDKINIKQAVTAVQAPAEGHRKQTAAIIVEKPSRPNEVTFTRKILENGKKGHVSEYDSCVYVLELHCNEYISALEKYCKFSTSNKEKLEDHLEKSHGIKKFRCLSRDCYKRSFSNRGPLMLHLKNHHAGKLHCKGENCAKVFKTISGIDRHYGKAHQKGLYQCIHCTTCKEYVNDFKYHKKCSKNTRISANNNYIEQMGDMRSK